MKRKIKNNNKKIFFVVILIILILAEIKLRVNESEEKNIPFFYNKEISIYPELYTQLENYDSNKTNILLLGGSVIKFINVLDTFRRNNKNDDFQFYNLGISGHTSIDSLNKLKYLTEKNYYFDYILFYHGINDVKLNNFPDESFKENYQHYGYFKYINTVFNENILNNFLDSVIIQRMVYKYYTINNFKAEFVIRSEWLQYGANIKSKQTFNNALIEIIKISQEQNSTTIIPLFVYNIPENYSRELLFKKKLGYESNIYEEFPIDIYGTRENIIQGIDTHNNLIINLSKHYDINMINLSSISNNPSYFTDGIHFSEKGKELFVKIITDKIRELEKNN